MSKKDKERGGDHVFIALTMYLLLALIRVVSADLESSDCRPESIILMTSEESSHKTQKNRVRKVTISAHM